MINNKLPLSITTYLWQSALRQPQVQHLLAPNASVVEGHRAVRIELVCWREALRNQGQVQPQAQEVVQSQGEGNQGLVEPKPMEQDDVILEV